MYSSFVFGRRKCCRRLVFFNLRTSILLQGPLRWFELLEKVDWVASSLELSVTESQESLLGTELGDVVGLGTVLDSELDIPALGDTGLGTALGTTLGIALGDVVGLGTELGESPGFGTRLGTGLGIPAFGDTGLGRAIGTALGDVAGLCTELGVGTGLGEPTLLGDRDLGK